MGLLLIFAYVTNCWSLGRDMHKKWDSKMGQMIYLLWRVVLMEFIQNEQISNRNRWEIHKNSKKC